jgi:hypothetical protein
VSNFVLGVGRLLADLANALRLQPRTKRQSPSSDLPLDASVVDRYASSAA